MIVCTKTLDSIAKQAFGKQNVMVSAIDKMIEEFALDPAVSQYSKEAFIVSNTDLRNPKVKQRFLTAAATKHPSVRIVYVVRSGKSDVQPVNGIDKVLERPRAAELQSQVYEMTSFITQKNDVVSSADSVPVGIEPYRPEGLMHNTEETVNEFGEAEYGGTEQVQESENVEEVEWMPEELSDIPPAEPTFHVNLSKQSESELVERIKSCNKISDLAAMKQELTATNLIKDLVKSNTQYVNVENRLKALNEKVYAIYADTSIPSLEVKLDKIKALLYDKDAYMSSANTLIEQRVEEVVVQIVDSTKKLLSQRLQELDNAIVSLQLNPHAEINYTRIAGINDERANLLLELTVVDREIQDIFCATDSMTMQIADNIANASADMTGSKLLNARLRLHGDSVVSDKSLQTIINIMSTAERTSDEFKEATRELVLMKNKLNKLIDLDKEQIASLVQIVKFLEANKVEDNIIKETIIKKSLRIFVAEEGTGRTVVPYILSKLKSRENYNVLYMDLTGTNKISDYGDQAYDFDDWMQNRYQKEFCAVTGLITSSEINAQKLMVALIKAADYYRVINLVLSPKQMELIQTIAPDVLVINYITDTKKANLDFMRDFIKKTAYDNVAQRIIINKCDIPVRPLLDRLDVVEAADVHVVTIRTVPQIVECSLNGARPYELTSAEDAFREVRKVC